MMFPETHSQLAGRLWEVPAIWGTRKHGALILQHRTNVSNFTVPYECASACPAGRSQYPTFLLIKTKFMLALCKWELHGKPFPTNGGHMASLACPLLPHSPHKNCPVI